MGKTYINPYVTVNAVDLSTYVGAVTINEPAASLNVTGGGATNQEYIGGLKDAEVTLDLFNDFASSKVYHTIKALVGGTTSVVIKPRSGSTDTDNPQWTCVAVVTDFSYLSGSVGDVDEYSVTWPVNSITEALS